MQPILSPSKVSVHLSSWDISRDFHFHSNLLIYIAANNWQDYIKSFSIHGWRKILFSWPKRDIIFLLSSWDIAILFDRLHRFELGAIRFPRIFFNSNTWYWDEKKAKLTNFIELAILEFWCPKRTHNTKSTLLPQKNKAAIFWTFFVGKIKWGLMAGKKLTAKCLKTFFSELPKTVKTKSKKSIALCIWSQ